MQRDLPQTNWFMQAVARAAGISPLLVSMNTSLVQRSAGFADGAAELEELPRMIHDKLKV